MAPFNVPTPCIIPLRVPVFGEYRNIDTNTKIELLCETDIPNVEIFYTLDGTKPQPYSGIIQGSKIKKFVEPFCLPSGKITIKAVAIHAQIHSMCSSVITKCFRVDGVAPKIGTVKDNLKKKIQQEKFKLGSKLQKSDEGEDKFDGAETEPLRFLDCVDKLNDTENESKLLTYPAASSYLQYEIEENVIEIKDKDSIDSNATYIIDSEEIENCERQSPDDSFKENGTIEDESEIFQVKETATSCDILPAQSHNCSTCEMPLQHCFACNKLNTIISIFCDKCGKKLVQKCVYCQENNPSIAIFCQYCGKKIESNQERENEVPSSSNRSVMVKPQVKSFSAQKTPSTMNRSAQTIAAANKKNIHDIDFKMLRKQTPGRGFWRQQIDYICNHLKAHAYNNLDFRKSIGEPSLHEFLSANIYKKDDNIVVQMEFSSLSSEQMHLIEHLHENKN